MFSVLKLLQPCVCVCVRLDSKVEDRRKSRNVPSKSVFCGTSPPPNLSFGVKSTRWFNLLDEGGEMRWEVNAIH